MRRSFAKCVGKRASGVDTSARRPATNSGMETNRSRPRTDRRKNGPQRITSETHSQRPPYWAGEPLRPVAVRPTSSSRPNSACRLSGRGRLPR
jgi:hypothetical protein